MNVAAVLLAAGSSCRLGRPKQTIELNGEILVARAIRIARDAGLHPVIAVIADLTLTEALQTAGAVVVPNPHASEGIASSIRAGIDAASARSVSGAVLMTCDQVAVTAARLRSLCIDPSTATGSEYAGTIGIPAYFPSSAFKDLLQLRGDRGARDLLRHTRSVPLPELSLDIDTAEDLERALKLFENKQLR